jgi:hypothetical protein
MLWFFVWPVAGFVVGLMASAAVLYISVPRWEN